MSKSSNLPIRVPSDKKIIANKPENSMFDGFNDYAVLVEYADLYKTDRQMYSTGRPRCVIIFNFLSCMCDATTVSGKYIHRIVDKSMLAIVSLF